MFFYVRACLAFLSSFAVCVTCCDQHCGVGDDDDGADAEADDGRMLRRRVHRRVPCSAQ